MTNSEYDGAVALASQIKAKLHVYFLRHHDNLDRSQFRFSDEMAERRATEFLKWLSHEGYSIRPLVDTKPLRESR